MQGKVKQSAQATVYAGIDVSKAFLDVALWPINIEFRMANNKKGHKLLATKLAEHQVALCTLEATGKHHVNCHLLLHERGIAVALINPYRSRKFADALGHLAKTDRIDAMMLAKFAGMLEPQPQNCQ